MKSDSCEQQANIFKILAHPARIAILEILRDGEHCVCHMEAYLGYRQAYISQQLKLMRDAGLIQDRRDGWNIFYRVTDLRIFEILDTVRDMENIPAFHPPNAGKITCSCPMCSPVLEAPQTKPAEQQE